MADAQRALALNGSFKPGDFERLAWGPRRPMKSPTFHATSVLIEALIRIKFLWNFFASEFFGTATVRGALFACGSPSEPRALLNYLNAEMCQYQPSIGAPCKA